MEFYVNVCVPIAVLYSSRIDIPAMDSGDEFLLCSWITP